MNIQALIQAAQGGDPQAAQFIQQLLSGGTPLSQRLPEIQPQEIRPAEFAESAEGSGWGEGAGALGSALGDLPVFDPVRKRMDEMRDGWFNRGQEPQQPGGFQPQPMDVSGLPATSLGGSQQDPGMIGQMEDPMAQAQQEQAQQVQAAGATGPQMPPEEGDDIISLIGRLLGQGGA